MERIELQALVKVVQCGSFTRAANLLGTQKAHLSRLLSQLEKKLGARLLERTTRALSLTEVGREVFERAIGILGAIEETEGLAKRMQTAPVGSLKLTCGVEFGMIAVSGWINRYLQRFPEVKVDAEYTGRLVDIVHEGFDLAIRVGALSDSSLAARKLGVLDYGLFAAPAYLSRRGTPAHPNALEAHDLLRFSSASHRQGWLLTANGVEIRISTEARLQLNNSFAIRDAAIAGLGIAKLPWLIAHAKCQLAELVPVLEQWASPQVPVNAVFASTRYLAPKVRCFIDHAVSEFDAQTL